MAAQARQGWLRRKGKGVGWLLMTAVAAPLALVVVAPGANASPVKTVAGEHLAKVTAGSTAPGRMLHARVSDHARRYTARQLKELNRKLLETDDMNKGRIVRPGRVSALNAPTQRPGTTKLATTLVRNSTIPATGIRGGSGNASFVQEPSTDANGQYVFQTGNWYATRSLNAGRSWSYLDPYTLFGSGFCCDQVTIYDPNTHHQFWLLQFGDHLVLANAAASGSSAFTNWCYWNIDATWFGLPAGTGLDYNDMSMTNNNINIATNYFGSASTGAAILRLPKQPMSTCSGFNYSRLNRSDNFTFKLVPGSADTLYFGSNWGQNNGSSFRVYAWPENTFNYSWVDSTVASYGFYTRNSGQYCGSADGVVTNWCQYADSRVLGAYRTGGVIGFSFNANQDSAHPFPYTRVVWFRESDRAYLGAGDLWGSWGAIQFLTLAPNSLGRVGGLFAWGGGTGSVHFYPGSATYSTDVTSIATDPNYFLYGQGNTCTYGGLYRWGDYLTVRVFKANRARWIGAGYAIRGGDCGSSTAYAQPHNVVFY